MLATSYKPYSFLRNQTPENHSQAKAPGSTVRSNLNNVEIPPLNLNTLTLNEHSNSSMQAINSEVFVDCPKNQLITKTTTYINNIKRNYLIVTETNLEGIQLENKLSDLIFQDVYNQIQALDATKMPKFINTFVVTNTQTALQKHIPTFIELRSKKEI